MAIDDYGIEALKKSAELVDSSSLADTYFKVWDNWIFQKVGRNIQVAYPSATTETYTFRQDSTTLYVLTITYTSSAKTDLSSVERTS